MPEVPFLSWDDVRLLREVIARERRRRERTGALVGQQESEWPAPDLYLALAPDEGIGALVPGTGTGTGEPSLDHPGTAECDLYLIDDEGGVEAVAGLSQVIHGAAGAVVASRYFAAARTKRGAWVALALAGAPGVIAVREVDLNPTLSGVDTLEFHQADGFAVSQHVVFPADPLPGVAQVRLSPADYVHAGGVSAANQRVGGYKMADAFLAGFQGGGNPTPILLGGSFDNDLPGVVTLPGLVQVQPYAALQAYGGPGPYGLRYGALVGQAWSYAPGDVGHGQNAHWRMISDGTFMLLAGNASPGRYGNGWWLGRSGTFHDQAGQEMVFVGGILIDTASGAGTGSAAPPGTGTGGGLVATACCPGGLPAAMNLVLADLSGCPCVAGTYPVAWDGLTWSYDSSSGVPCSADQIQINLQCVAGPTWSLAVTLRQGTSAVTWTWLGVAPADCTLPIDLGANTGHSTQGGGVAGCAAADGGLNASLAA